MGEDVELTTPVLLFALGSTFTFPKGFMLNVNTISGEGAHLAYEMVEPLHELEISLSKSFQ